MVGPEITGGVCRSRAEFALPLGQRRELCLLDLADRMRRTDYELQRFAKEGGVARMICIARQVGTLIFLLAWLVPWRPAFRTRAKQSKLSFFADPVDLGIPLPQS